MLDQDPTYSARFWRITDDNTFQKPSDKYPTPNEAMTRYQVVGRNIIDCVDPNICEYLANFNLSAVHANSTNTQLPEAALRKLNGTPEALLTSLVQYIDFLSMAEPMKERNIVSLASLVTQRFTAISLIAHTKRLQGKKSSYDKSRHESVLATRAGTIKLWQGQADVGSQAFSDFMRAGCRLQSDYMRDKEQQGKPIETRLSQLGIGF